MCASPRVLSGVVIVVVAAVVCFENTWRHSSVSLWPKGLEHKLALFGLWLHLFVVDMTMVVAVPAVVTIDAVVVSDCGCVCGFVLAVVYLSVVSLLQPLL